MSSAGDSRPRATSDLSPLTLGLASLASVVATVMVSRFGLAGTVAGAALAPVVIAIVRELGRKPVERVVRLPTGARAVVRRRPEVRPRIVAVTAAIAFVAAVAVFTVPDMLAGSSVVSERPSTFFSGGSGGSGDGGGGTTTTPTTTDGDPAVTAPSDPAVTAPEPGVTAPVTTAPAEPTAPATAPAPVTPPPAETAPAPAPAAPATTAPVQPPG